MQRAQTSLKQTRGQTVTFNIGYEQTKTISVPNSRHEQKRGTIKSSTGTRSRSKVRTADLSHTSDHIPTFLPPSFIPDEYRQEIQTPTPLRPGQGNLNTTEKTWHTTVFPSENIASREEVQNLGEWLNRMLRESNEQTTDPSELGLLARKWYSITFDELSRQVAVECDERSKLLRSIWGRYQSLFSRVEQLHQEERDYLITCHRERTAVLKQQLEETQGRLKALTRQYRDDQERWSNEREREENRFANMRKKLDLQVKNKRQLLMELKILREAADNGFQPEIKEQREEEVKEEEFTQDQISDKVRTFRQLIRNEHRNLVEVSACLDDLAKYTDNEPISPNQHARELLPTILRRIPITKTARIRPLKWVCRAMTFVYAQRLTRLVQRRQIMVYEKTRFSFADEVFQIFLQSQGTQEPANAAMYDLIETARHFAPSNIRCRTFLQFLDCAQPYYDSVMLDFYCFCLGSFMASITTSTRLILDDFDSDPAVLYSVNESVGNDLAKKVLFTISEGRIAEEHLAKLSQTLTKNEKGQVSIDDIIFYLMDAYVTEEKRATEELCEQFEMDAGIHGGISTLGQFQTLSLFSSRKLEARLYTRMMMNAFSHTGRSSLTFEELVTQLHQMAMLAPFNFDRIEYNIEMFPNDMFDFVEEEFNFHIPEIDTLIEKAKRSDENLATTLSTAKTKMIQVIETKRICYFSEVSQREFYDLLHKTVID